MSLYLASLVLCPVYPILSILQLIEQITGSADKRFFVGQSSLLLLSFSLLLTLNGLPNKNILLTFFISKANLMAFSFCLFPRLYRGAFLIGANITHQHTGTIMHSTSLRRYQRHLSQRGWKEEPALLNVFFLF